MQIETVKTNRPTPISLTKTFEASIHEFSDFGVEATSLGQISTATGVPTERLSKTFHDTANLFSNVVKWYLTRYEHQILSGFAMHSNPVEAIRIALYECIELFCEDDCPHGSLLSVELMEISDTDGVIAKEMAHLKEQVHGRIYQKLENCKQCFTSGFRPNELAEFYTEVMAILIKQACDGVDRTDLYNLADASLERLENQPVIH
ncbi:DNA-binding transcriptional repressor AcrR [Pseudovibrio sp. W64]|uniref:TetR/AcrR family transcriptional regulator n=1 Tax=Pseudovibrio sp. W64 TaxID=1735583 RepID=UPI0007AE5FB1|nr:TetR/AcrR family transcriptional regulator [Pseudovibrio sp. W64]KZK78549.1 DNA-binding transcriptional repressor AcrR [Pseudovibrio sp. W64]